MNETFGWLWVMVGFISGGVIGVRFQREDWLGGYASPQRRFIRLGHIAFLGLGLLNILFAHSLERIRLVPSWLAVASWSLILGAAMMPLCCGLMAWRRALKPLFVLPVGCLLVGVALTCLGLLTQ
jgi:hypothetical protein